LRVIGDLVIWLGVTGMLGVCAGLVAARDAQIVDRAMRSERRTVS
jgi:hypothetical protein